MKADKLASFRLNSELWEQFQTVARDNGTTATALLIGYIQSVVNTGSVITTTHQSIQPCIDNSPKLSIQDIDKRIDDKINTVIQGINTQSIQDIDCTIKKQIADSLEDGDIGGAIAKSYAAVMGNFNELLYQVQELKAAIPPAAVPSPQLPITNHQPIESGVSSQEAGENLPAGDIESDRPNSDPSPETDKKRKIIEFFAGVDIYSPITTELIQMSGIGEKIKTNKEELEGILGGKINTKSKVVLRVRDILKGAGFDVGGNPDQGYFVVKE